MILNDISIYHLEFRKESVKDVCNNVYMLNTSMKL